MEASGNENDLTFRKTKEVLEWLQAEGWKVKKSSLYRHIQEGRIHTRKDAQYHLRDVKRYARLNLKRGDSNQSQSQKLDSLQEKRIVAETKKMEAQAEHWDIKAKVEAGLYVERSSFERALAFRAIVFRQGLENFIHTNTPEIIRQANGDLALTPDVINYLLEQVSGWLATYAENREFEVHISPAVENETPRGDDEDEDDPLENEN